MQTFKKIGTFLVGLVFVCSCFFSYGIFENILLASAEDVSVKGNYAVISNESIDETNLASTGSFSLEDSNPTIDNNLSLESYKMDYVMPLKENFTIDTVNNISTPNMMISAQVYNVGTTSMSFITVNFSSNNGYYYETINATLMSSGTKSNVWVNMADYNMSLADADKITSEFDSNIYAQITSVFGLPSDIDRDGKVNILCFDIKDGFSGSGGYIAGYFDPNDLNKFYAYSNKMEVFYIDTYPAMGTGSTKDVTQCYDTLAHEFQHMVNSNRNVLVEHSVDMDTWLNEGLSEAASQIYSGQISTSRINYYNYSTEIINGRSLIKWDDNNSLANYSLSYLFLQYLKEQVGIGNSVFTEVMLSSFNDYRAVESVIQAHIDQNLTFGRFMTNFRAALLLKKPTGPYGFKGNSGYNIIQPRIYTGSATSLYGGGAIVIPANPTTGMITIPSNKGATVNYLIVQNPPILTLSPYITTPTKGDITVTATTDVGTLEVTSHTFTQNGSFEFVATNLIGDITKRTVTITNIDKTPPIITIGGYSTSITNQNIIVSASTNEGTLNQASHTFTQNGSFVFIATDLAGNASSSTVTITNIDKTAPIITGVINGGSYDITTIGFSEGSVTLNGLPFSNGSVIRTSGIYQLIATDFLGNSSTLSFTINPTQYNYDNEKLTGIEPNTVLIDFKDDINILPIETAKIFNKFNIEITDNNTVIGTAMYLKIFEETVLKSSYKIIIYGDVTGDGSIGLSDLTSIRDDLLGNTPLVGDYKTAGDLYGEEKITLNDLVGIMAHISESSSISQTARA